MTQAEKCHAFRALHEREGAFLIPNPWDIGTARMLAQLGFEALATTSAGFAFSIGQCDNTVSREQMMAHVSAIAAATDLPVSADLENGFGDSPEVVAETIRLAIAAGLPVVLLRMLLSNRTIQFMSRATLRIGSARQPRLHMGFRFPSR